MNKPMLPIRDASESLMMIDGVVVPYIIHKGIVLWIEACPMSADEYVRQSEVKFPDLSNDMRVTLDGDCVRRFDHSCAYSKPLPNQSLELYSNLENRTLASCRYYRAYMVGLYELLKNKNLPSGDNGEAYALMCDCNGVKFYTVFADSAGAAKRFMREFVIKHKIKEAFAEAGVDPKHASDFEQF